jgi:hypothetical protein
MSTRGAFGFGTMASWRGVYNHSDSQATSLGPELWRVLTRELDDLPALCDRLLAAGRVEDFLNGTVATGQDVNVLSAEMRRMMPAVLERMRRMMGDEDYAAARQSLLEEYGDESE